jgi:hypothetical protein
VSTSFDCREDGGHCQAGLLASDQGPVNLPSLRPKLSQLQFSSRAVNPEKFLEFLGTDPQRSHTSGLSPTIQRFLAWVERAGIKTSRPRFSRTEGKTAAFVEGEIQKLLGAIETSTHNGLRDRSCLFQRVPGFHGGCRCTRLFGSPDETLRCPKRFVHRI